MKIQVKIEEQVFEVSIEDVHARPVIATVGGERFEVWPESQPAETTPGVTQGLKIAPLATTTIAPSPQAGGSLAVSAPLPGVIVGIEVKAGDAVKPGQALITLEAMKMKNAIRATRDAIVAEVHVANGDQVQHGQLLITYQA